MASHQKVAFVKSGNYQNLLNNIFPFLIKQVLEVSQKYAVTYLTCLFAEYISYHSDYLYHLMLTLKKISS